MLAFVSYGPYLLIQQSQLLYGLKIPISIKFYHLALIYSKLLWSPELAFCPVAGLMALNTISMWHG